MLPAEKLNLLFAWLQCKRLQLPLEATARRPYCKKFIAKNQVPFPPEIEPLFSKEEKTYKIAASQEKIEEFIAEKLAAMV